MLRHVVTILFIVSLSYSSPSFTAEGEYYFGAGLGFSTLKPDPNDTGYDNTKSDSSGIKGFFGYDLGEGLSVEFEYNDMGAAELANDTRTGEMDYRSIGLSGVYRDYVTENISLFGKLGLAQVDLSSANLNFETQNETPVFGGFGLEYDFADTWAVRGEYEFFTPDAQMASVSAIKRFGKSVTKAAQPLPPKKNNLPKVCYTPIALRGIHFDTNKDIIKPQSYPVIQRLAADIRQCPVVTMAIVGHTDSRASATYNQKLSLRRARSVMNALIHMGVSAHQLTYFGRGESNPVASNKTKQGMALNRRVEVIPMNSGHNNTMGFRVLPPRQSVPTTQHGGYNNYGPGYAPAPAPQSVPVMRAPQQHYGHYAPVAPHQFPKPTMQPPNLPMPSYASPVMPSAINGYQGSAYRTAPHNSYQASVRQ